MYTKVPGCGSTDRVLLLAEKASVVCAETRAGGQRGKVLDWLAFSFILTVLLCASLSPIHCTLVNCL